MSRLRTRRACLILQMMELEVPAETSAPMLETLKRVKRLQGTAVQVRWRLRHPSVTLTIWAAEERMELL